MSTKKTNVFIIILAVIFWPITIIVLLAKSSNTNSSNGYKKVFPHVTTDDNSSDADKEIDDMIFMDIMDDD